MEHADHFSLYRRIQPYGHCTSIDIIPEKFFGYIQLEDSSPALVQSFIYRFNCIKWKGHVWKIYHAKPDYKQVLEERWKQDAIQVAKANAAMIIKKQKKQIVQIIPHAPIQDEGIGDHFRPALPTEWVRLKLGGGRYLPILHLESYPGDLEGFKINPTKYVDQIQILHYHVKDVNFNRFKYRLTKGAIESHINAQRSQMAGEIELWSSRISKCNERMDASCPPLKRKKLIPKHDGSNSVELRKDQEEIASEILERKEQNQSNMSNVIGKDRLKLDSPRDSLKENLSSQLKGYRSKNTSETERLMSLLNKMVKENKSTTRPMEDRVVTFENNAEP